MTCSRAALAWILTALAVGSTVAAAAPENSSSSRVSIGLSFTGSTFGVDRDSTFIPPDANGAIGPNHFVELINGRYTVYDKRFGTRVLTRTLDDFWRDAGVPLAGGVTDFAFDPRVLYDPHSGRWFAAAVHAKHNPNNFLLAVSRTADPRDGWDGFKIDSDVDDSHFADFPTLGLDRDGVYLAADFEPVDSSSETEMRTGTLIVPKRGLLESTPRVSGLTLFEDMHPDRTGASLQPVVNLDTLSGDGDTASAHGGFTSFLSHAETSDGRLRRLVARGSVDAPDVPQAGVAIEVPAFPPPPDADQPGLKQNLDAQSDHRFSGSVVRRNGDLWAVQTADGGAGRAALRWLRIDPDLNEVIESGLIADDDLAFYYGSIAVNEFGDVVIGFSGSSENQFVSGYAAVGRTLDGVTSFDDPILLAAGAGSYELLDSKGRNRWGDYSATTVDPSDPLSFWTIQTIASAEDVWSTHITQIRVAPTAIPLPPALAAALPVVPLVLCVCRPRRRIP